MDNMIIFASNNKHKLQEISSKLTGLGIKVISQKEAGYNIDVEETGKTFEENAVLKAEAIYKLSNKPIIAEDSGLEVDFLNGEPGVYSARYAGENATDVDRINKVLNLMKDATEKKQRSARFKSTICYIDKNGIKHIFEGVCEGYISKEPIGNNDFGYDPIFMYGDRSFAEMTAEEKNKISHRGKALSKFVDYLKLQATI